MSSWQNDACVHVILLATPRYDGPEQMAILANAVVTPLRKAASYEQRKTNLGNLNFLHRKRHILSHSATYYAALTRVSCYRHVG